MYAHRMANDLTRLTVNLIPRAAEALDEAAALTRDTRTDVVNRALQVYAYLEQQQARGKRILISDLDGSIELIRLL